MTTHAQLSPSSAHRWTSCTASINEGAKYPDPGSSGASRMGTLCHTVAELVLTRNEDPLAFAGKTHLIDGEHIEFTAEIADAVHRGTEYVLSYQLMNGGDLRCEQRVPIDHITGEEDAGGTSDVVIVGDTWIFVGDFKFGRKKVEASIADEMGNRTPNLQMAMYALGALASLDPAVRERIEIVHMHIIQPMIDWTDDFTLSVAELQETSAFLSAKAEETRSNPQFMPSVDNCFYCRAKGNCSAQSALVIEAAVEGFEDVNTAAIRRVTDLSLGDKYALVPIIRAYADAIDELVDKALDAGQIVERSDGLTYKRVAGKRGQRKWADEAEVTSRLLQTLPEDVVFSKSLNSPSTIEKLTKGKAPVVDPGTWDELQALISQSEGKPAVVLSTDPRPAIGETDLFAN